LKLELTKTKLYLLGTSGLLAISAAGIGLVAHAASPAPSAAATTVTPTTAENPEPAETPSSTEAPAAGTAPVEAPASAGTTAADAAGGHADPPGATVDHQFDGQE
jgi:hypothetical protein